MVKRYRNKKKDNFRLWSIYHDIKKRCNNPNSARFKDYGGRGIKMCDEWLNDFDSFADWSKNNGYSDELTIDRKDVDGNYEPQNCRWITIKEQCRNKRNTVLVEYNGVTKPLIVWCEELGLIYDTMHYRIKKRGWSVEKAFETKSQREDSFASQCKAHGISENVVRDRVNKLGWDLDTALNTKCLGLGANQKSYPAKGVVDNA